eukprot:TRINITY_DN74753_c0_g1_i1.p1 TRINITY_DN74753_c0_g1~~TRINITY_DN74753_c0_g1_i1.p1  ORF type:complete len:454 (+),score=9.86 TRINITY_DN74753_c0_g1_i1:73-1434(+)
MTFSKLPPDTICLISGFLNSKEFSHVCHSLWNTLRYRHLPIHKHQTGKPFPLAICNEADRVASISFYQFFKHREPFTTWPNFAHLQHLEMRAATSATAEAICEWLIANVLLRCSWSLQTLNMPARQLKIVLQQRQTANLQFPQLTDLCVCGVPPEFDFTSCFDCMPELTTLSFLDGSDWDTTSFLKALKLMLNSISKLQKLSFSVPFNKLKELDAVATSEHCNFHENTTLLHLTLRWGTNHLGPSAATICNSLLEALPNLVCFTLNTSNCGHQKLHLRLPPKLKRLQLIMFGVQQFSITGGNLDTLNLSVNRTVALSPVHFPQLRFASFNLHGRHQVAAVMDSQIEHLPHLQVLKVQLSATPTKQHLEQLSHLFTLPTLEWLTIANSYVSSCDPTDGLADLFGCVDHVGPCLSHVEIMWDKVTTTEGAQAMTRFQEQHKQVRLMLHTTGTWPC